MAEHNLLNNYYKTKLKRKEKLNKKEQAVRKFWQFYFAQKQDDKILFISDFDYW